MKNLTTADKMRFTLALFFSLIFSIMVSVGAIAMVKNLNDVSCVAFGQSIFALILSILATLTFVRK